jgi:hypothetical protein
LRPRLVVLTMMAILAKLRKVPTVPGKLEQFFAGPSVKHEFQASLKNLVR